MNHNLIMAAVFTSNKDILKVITVDDREHYITEDSYFNAYINSKNGDVLLNNCEIVDVM